MFFRDLVDVRSHFDLWKGTLLGVGMTGYSRIIPGYFCHPYHIISLRKTKDLPLLRKMAQIFCLEEELGENLANEGFNSARLLGHPLVRSYLTDLPDPKYLLLYQSYPELEALAREENWILLANPASLRSKVADREFFHRMVDDLQLSRIPGQVSPIDNLYTYDYGYWSEKISSRLVIRLLDVLHGGGKGIFFIESAPDYLELLERLREGRWRGVELRSVSIDRFMEGIPVSIALCITRHGILFSGIQRQLIDLPYCQGIVEKGIFCGHSWGETCWSSDLKEDVMGQARLMGGYLADLGYRGILGIDFLISEGRVYPLELNPRFTGAFPMLSQLHLDRHIIPLELFHILEFVDRPYEMDLDLLNARYEETVRGSHLILFRMGQGVQQKNNTPGAGLYELDPEMEMISYLDQAFDYPGLQNDRQFIIIDGPPDINEEEATPKDPLKRLCRILFPFPVMDEWGGISPEALFVADQIYQRIIQ